VDDPAPGQQQLFEVAPGLPARLSIEGRMPQYEDVVLTAEQVEEAKREWPTKTIYRRGPDGRKVVDRVVELTEREQISRMKTRILTKLRHEVVVDPVTGQRAFGGVQRGNGTIKKKRLDEQLVEAADRRQQEISDAFFAPLSPDNPAMDRHKAALNISREAREIRKLELAEDDLERASDDEVRREAAKVIAEMFRNGELKPDDLADIISISDADVIEA